MATKPAAGLEADVPAGPSGRKLFPLAVEAVCLAAVSGLVLLGERSAPAFPPDPLIGSTRFLWYFLSAFAASTVLRVLLLRARRGSRWFASFFSLAVFIGIGIISERFWGADGAILATASAVLLHYGLRRVAVFDLVLVIGLARTIRTFDEIFAVSPATYPAYPETDVSLRGGLSPDELDAAVASACRRMRQQPEDTAIMREYLRILRFLVDDPPQESGDSEVPQDGPRARSLNQIMRRLRVLELEQSIEETIQ